MSVYEQVIKFHGKEHQLKKAIENLDELKLEIKRMIDGNGNIINLISDMADVHNRLRELKIIFEISAVQLDFEMGRKMGLVLRKMDEKCNKCIYDSVADCSVCDFKEGK